MSPVAKKSSEISLHNEAFVTAQICLYYIERVLCAAYFVH